MAEEEFDYYQLNVNYSVSVRNFEGDADGVLLSPRGRNTIAVPKDKLRTFRNANKAAIKDAKIVPITEPTIEWDTANALTDEDVSELVKNFPKLKSTIATIDSLPILYKVRDVARERELSKRTLSTIEARIAELEPEEAPIFRKEDMQGSRDG
jgi:hypothetical protein